VPDHNLKNGPTVIVYENLSTFAPVAENRCAAPDSAAGEKLIKKYENDHHINHALRSQFPVAGASLLHAFLLAGRG
jgi:hypothetical protein